MEKIDFLFPEEACLSFNRDECYIFDTFSISFNFLLLFGRGPNRVMETACFDANVP